MPLEWFAKHRRWRSRRLPLFGKPSVLPIDLDDYTIFDVGGSRYRIVAVIHYDKQRLYVRRVMTHAEYDRDAWRKR